MIRLALLFGVVLLFMDANRPQRGGIKVGVASLERAQESIAAPMQRSDIMARTTEPLRWARALVGSTDALERLDASRAPGERKNCFYFRQLINRINLGVSLGAYSAIRILSH
jgi:hypothetical protein